MTQNLFTEQLSASQPVTEEFFNREKWIQEAKDIANKTDGHPTFTDEQYESFFENHLTDYFGEQYKIGDFQVVIGIRSDNNVELTFANYRTVLRYLADYDYIDSVGSTPFFRKKNTTL